MYYFFTTFHKPHNCYHHHYHYYHNHFHHALIIIIVGSIKSSTKNKKALVNTAFHTSLRDDSGDVKREVRKDWFLHQQSHWQLAAGKFSWQHTGKQYKKITGEHLQSLLILRETQLYYNLYIFYFSQRCVCMYAFGLDWSGFFFWLDCHHDHDDDDDDDDDVNDGEGWQWKKALLLWAHFQISLHESSSSSDLAWLSSFSSLLLQILSTLWPSHDSNFVSVFKYKLCVHNSYNW